MKIPRPVERATLVVLVVGIVVLAVRDGGDLVKDTATMICGKMSGCLRVMVTPDKLESRVAEFTMQTGDAVDLLLIFKDGKFVGTLPLK